MKNKKNISAYLFFSILICFFSIGAFAKTHGGNILPKKVKTLDDKIDVILKYNMFRVSVPPRKVVVKESIRPRVNSAKIKPVKPVVDSHLVLKGITIVGRSASALFVHTSDHRRLTVKVNQKLSIGKITKIDIDAVTFSVGNKKRVIKTGQNLLGEAYRKKAVAKDQKDAVAKTEDSNDKKMLVENNTRPGKHSDQTKRKRMQGFSRDQRSGRSSFKKRTRTHRRR